MGNKLGNLLNSDETIYRALKGNEEFYELNYTPGADLFIDKAGCSVFACMRRNEEEVICKVVERVRICKSIFKLTVDLCLSNEVYPIQHGSNYDHALLLNSHLKSLIGRNCHQLSLLKAEFLAKNCEIAIEFQN